MSPICAVVDVVGPLVDDSGYANRDELLGSSVELGIDRGSRRLFPVVPMDLISAQG